ncbi:TetR/AcrR family transcriptional regulator [Streptomycetaceae bacterium NBC_01309]
MSVEQVTSPRRAQILREAARLFAARGFHGVSVDEIGAASGITGPGLYRHFRGKDAMLAELLIGISERLLSGGRECLDAHDAPADRLDALIARHVDFALGEPALIVVHDRDLASLPEADQRKVRRLQRAYVEIWVGVVVDAYPGFARDAQPAPATEAQARASVHAVFGLLNSTPHSAAAGHRGPRPPAPDTMAALLRTLALGAFAAAGR